MKVKKVTTGFVIQVWDTELNKWVSQEFVASDECDYEDEMGNPVEYEVVLPDPEPYLPYDMIQP